MTYTQGTDFISDTVEVRRLARNVVTGDFTDAQIQNYQYYTYSFIKTVTNKGDWDPDDVEFGALKQIETDVTAAEIEKHFGDGSAETLASANSSISSAWASLKTLVDNMDTTTTVGGAFEIQRTAFKSWNRDAGVAIPRGRLSPSLGGIEGANSREVDL